MQLRVEATFSGGVVVLRLNGEVSLSTLPYLSDMLNKAIQEHPAAPFVVNVNDLTMLDDAGIGILMGFAGKLRGINTSCIVMCTQPAIRSRLAATGFDLAVSVIDDANSKY
jgi:anti-anti-sigma factor